MDVAVIGGGAAGFFAALSVKQHHPKSKVTIFEKSQKLLAKVKISGGGRCNVTNGCTSISQLAKAYPRGEKPLKKAFRTFSTQDTMDWFRERKVGLVIQEDGCVFPKTQDSQTIIDCFMREANRLGIQILTGMGVNKLQRKSGKMGLSFIKDHEEQWFDKVIIATGGSPKKSGLIWLADLGHQIEDPVPSLFTFNMPKETITALMGIVVEHALVSIQGTKLKSSGPLLITHWGMSGPAILKLSAFGARILHDRNYTCKAQVNWVNTPNNDEVATEIQHIIGQYPKKILANIRPYFLPERLWHFLIEKSGLSPKKKWEELGKKGINKLVTLLTNDVYEVEGKTTFKEEFVTCGGVSLSSIDFKTMQSKVVPNLYFAGEVMDIDGITGGYNFQSAWTTAFIAGKLL